MLLSVTKSLGNVLKSKCTYILESPYIACVTTVVNTLYGFEELRKFCLLQCMSAKIRSSLSYAYHFKRLGYYIPSPLASLPLSLGVARSLRLSMT